MARMSNKAHDHVHRLVRSMTSMEKRYYKLHIGRKGPGGGQHELFDAIAAMEEYDEIALLERFKDQPFTRHFAITKRRLYESILRSLDAFHADRSVDARMHRILQQVDLLYQRALYDDAAKLLQSVRRLARQHDRQPILLAVLNWERRLMEQGNYGKAGIADVDRVAEEGRDVLAQQMELDTLWDLKSRVFLLLYREGRARDATAQKELSDLLQHPMLADKSPLRTARARFLRGHVRSAADFAMGDLAGCHAHLSANMELLRAERVRFADDPSLVIGVLSNLTYVCNRLGRYEEAAALLREFRTLPSTWEMPETEDLDLKLFISTNSLELSLLARTGEFERALELVRAIESGLQRHGGSMSAIRRAGFLYQVAFTYFGAGQADMALKWLQRLLNDVRMDESAEIVCFGRLLSLLAWMEAGRTDLLTYGLRNTERLLEARSRTFRFEPIYLDMIRNVLKAKTDAAVHDAIQQFHDLVSPLEHDPKEQAVFDLLDPLAWAESKLQGRPFAEMVKERAMRVGRAA